MRAFAALFVCTITVLLTTAAAVAVDHPANGQLTRDVPLDYGTADYGYPAGFSRGDITFGAQYPAPAKLLPPERYMLAGTMVPGQPAAGLPAWINSVTDFAIDYQKRYGMLPATITMEAVASLRGTAWAQLSPSDQALPFNPLTGLSPRLDAREFAPGNMYVRVLNADDMRYFAERRADLNDAWFNGRYHDPQTGATGQAELQSAVLYVRAYGASGVIYEDFVYRLSDPVIQSVTKTYAQAPAPAARKAPVKSDCAPSG